jgi:hypothetical protein
MSPAWRESRSSPATWAKIPFDIYRRQPNGDTVQQAVNMAPLGWCADRQGWRAGDQGSNQTGVPGEGGNGDPNRNPADDPAPGV